MTRHSLIFRLYGNADLHTGLANRLAARGYLVLVLEHEDRSASYCRTERDGAVLTYAPPPEQTPAQLARDPGALESIRGFRVFWAWAWA